MEIFKRVIAPKCLPQGFGVKWIWIWAVSCQVWDIGSGWEAVGWVVVGLILLGNWTDMRRTCEVDIFKDRV